MKIFDRGYGFETSDTQACNTKAGTGWGIDESGLIQRFECARWFRNQQQTKVCHISGVLSSSSKDVSIDPTFVDLIVEVSRRFLEDKYYTA